MLQTLYIMQMQKVPTPPAPMPSAPNPKDTMIFSVGLVITCLLVLIMLWLPDILKRE